MEWRESDGVRWLEADLGERPGGLLDPPRRRQRGALRQPQPRHPHRRRRRGGGREPPPARRGARLSTPSESPIGLPGPRRRAGASLSPQQPSPFAQPGNDLPERRRPRRHRDPDLAPLVFVADCLPVALAGRGGVAMLHCGWRGLAGGIVAARRRGGGRDRRGDRARDRALLLRGGRGGARELRRARRRRRRGPDARPAEVARRLLRRAGVERIESAGLCTSCEAELFFSHRRDRGAPAARPASSG